MDKREVRLFCTSLDGGAGSTDGVDLEAMLEVGDGGTVVEQFVIVFNISSDVITVVA